MHVVRLAPEVLLEEVVDRALKHERVIDRDVAYALHAVPAWLAATRDGLIHHVIRNQEKGLQLVIGR